MRAKDGVHADDLRALMFRVGAVTIPHAGAFLGLSRSSAHEALRGLERSGEVDRRDRGIPWREKRRRGPAPAHYFLSRRKGGVLAGAAANGIEYDDEKSRKRILGRHGSHNLPHGIPHNFLRNDLYATLVAHSGRLGPDLRVSVPVGGLWGETHGAFPLRGGPAKVRPDGLFEAVWRDGAGKMRQAYLVEAEVHERREELLKKIGAYAGLWLALRSEAVGEAAEALFGLYDVTREEAEGLAERRVAVGVPDLRPVVFVYPHKKQAVAMRRYAARAAEERRLELAPYLLLRERWAPHGLDPGRFVLFCALEDVRGHGPSALGFGEGGGGFCPLEAYLGSGPAERRVSLYDAACHVWEVLEAEEAGRRGHEARDAEARKRLSAIVAARRSAARRP